MNSSCTSNNNRHVLRQSLLQFHWSSTNFFGGSAMTNNDTEERHSKRICARILSDEEHRYKSGSNNSSSQQLQTRAKKEWTLLQTTSTPMVSTRENAKFLYPSAMHAANEPLNRYGNVLPEEHSRVLLDCSLADTDYINANTISATKLGCSNSFIATQAPMTNTFGHFWSMVYQYQSTCVVMLTPFVENCKRKADIYWPTEMNSPRRYESMVVELINEKHLKSMDIRTFNIHPTTDASRTHQVVHFHFTNWSDFAVPNPQDLIELISLVEIYRNRTPHAPVVAHCSAGLGRAGVFIATSLLIEQLKRGQEPEVFDTVLAMRGQRAGMVQTEAQYSFIYNILQHYCEQTKRLSIVGRSLSIDHTPCRAASPRPSSLQNVRTPTTSSSSKCASDSSCSGRSRSSTHVISAAKQINIDNNNSNNTIINNNNNNNQHYQLSLSAPTSPSCRQLCVQSTHCPAHIHRSQCIPAAIMP